MNNCVDLLETCLRQVRGRYLTTEEAQLVETLMCYRLTNVNDMSEANASDTELEAIETNVYYQRLFEAIHEVMPEYIEMAEKNNMTQLSYGRKLVRHIEVAIEMLRNKNA